jgi:hypothetical protein
VLPISSSLVERAANIVGADGISDADIEANVLALAGDALLARRLIDWLPEAFGLVLLPHVARVALPTTFSAKSATGRWMDFELQAESIFPIATCLGEAMYRSGPRNTFHNIAVRSSIVATVNKALDDVKSIDGATLSGLALIGIPAEAYLPPRKSIWRRLFE